jgi:O-antigen ligase
LLAADGPGGLSLSAPPAGARRRFQVEAMHVLILVAWAGVVVPRLMNSLLTEKHRVSVGEEQESAHVAVLAQRGLNFLLMALCVAIFLRNLRNLPTDRRLSLVVLIAPWVYLISRDLYIVGHPKLAVLLYPLLVLAVWSLRPGLGHLVLTGWLTALFVLLNLGLAIVLPAKGLFSSSAGELIAPEKQILPWGVLVGIFTQGNVLGVFLVLALPAVVLIRSPLNRLWIGALASFALVWTSSRSSLAALIMIVVVFVGLAALRASARGVFAAVTLIIFTAAVALIPITTTSNQAFTNRGYIWRTSLASWAEDPWFGLGSHWYSQIGQFVNALPGTAYHGHNLFVHALVTGGLIYVTLLTLMVLCLIYYAIVWAIRGVGYPLAFLVAFLVSATLEVPFGVVDNSALYAVTVLPMAVIVFSVLPANPLLRQMEETSSIMVVREPEPRY